MALCFNVKAWQGLKVFFHLDCRLLYRVFAHTLIRKGETLFFILNFRNCSQRRCWNIEIFCKFRHVLFSLLSETTITYFSIMGYCFSQKLFVTLLFLFAWLFATLLLQHPSQSHQAATRVRRVMSTFCEVARGVGDTWATCPMLLRGILGSQQKFRCCGWHLAHF